MEQSQVQRYLRNLAGLKLSLPGNAEAAQSGAQKEPLQATTPPQPFTEGLLLDEACAADSVSATGGEISVALSEAEIDSALREMSRAANLLPLARKIWEAGPSAALISLSQQAQQTTSDLLMPSYPLGGPRCPLPSLGRPSGRAAPARLAQAGASPRRKRSSSPSQALGATTRPPADRARQVEPPLQKCIATWTAPTLPFISNSWTFCVCASLDVGALSVAALADYLQASQSHACKTGLRASASLRRSKPSRPFPGCHA